MKPIFAKASVFLLIAASAISAGAAGVKIATGKMPTLHSLDLLAGSEWTVKADSEQTSSAPEQIVPVVSVQDTNVSETREDVPQQIATSTPEITPPQQTHIKHSIHGVSGERDEESEFGDD